MRENFESLPYRAGFSGQTIWLGLWGRPGGERDRLYYRDFDTVGLVPTEWPREKILALARERGAELVAINHGTRKLRYQNTLVLLKLKDMQSAAASKIGLNGHFF